MTNRIMFDKKLPMLFVRTNSVCFLQWFVTNFLVLSCAVLPSIAVDCGLRRRLNKFLIDPRQGRQCWEVVDDGIN